MSKQARGRFNLQGGGSTMAGVFNQSINQSWIYIAHTRKASNIHTSNLPRTAAYISVSKRSVEFTS